MYIDNSYTAKDTEDVQTIHGKTNVFGRVDHATI